MGENGTVFREELIQVCTILNEKSLLKNICMLSLFLKHLYYSATSPDGVHTIHTSYQFYLLSR